MHDSSGRPDDSPSKNLPYTLVSHADPKHRDAGPQARHYLQRDA